MADHVVQRAGAWAPLERIMLLAYDGLQDGAQNDLLKSIEGIWTYISLNKLYLLQRDRAKIWVCTTLTICHITIGYRILYKHSKHANLYSKLVLPEQSEIFNSQ